MRDGPVQDVPTSINLLDASAVSIWFDPNKVNNHFGDINQWDPMPYMRRVATIFQINQWAKTRLLKQHKMGANHNLSRGYASYTFFLWSIILVQVSERSIQLMNRKTY